MRTIISNFEKRFNIRVLMPEYAILLHLFERRKETSEQLRDVCNYSRTRYHAALRSLEARGLIEWSIHEGDLRVKLYNLSAYCREELRDMFAAMPGWISGQLAGNSIKGVMPRFTRELMRRMAVNHTSCAYEILLFLYDTPDQAVSELLADSNYSGATFSSTLSRLKEDGFVATRPDVNDARSVRCSLEPATAEFMEEQHMLLLKWLQANLEE